MYSDLPTVINAAGTLTRLSAGPLAPGVLEAMAAADRVSLDMCGVQAVASRAIAAATGAEAGMVTSGAAAGLLLSAAAVMAGLNVGRMNSLPQTDGPDEFIMSRGHRNGYDHALRAAGAKLVEVGLPEPLAGSGIRDAEPWEYEVAIGPQTAAIVYVASPQSLPHLQEVVAIARPRGIPVIVDAAAELPPAENLRRFAAAGADLVVFSGGKLLGGPAGTGLLFGRADLIMSAALQSLDMDMHFADWAPPADFIDRTRVRGLPRQGIGRCCKVGKHDVLGLLVALDHFLAEGDAARHARWLSVCERIGAAIDAPEGGAVSVTGAQDTGRVPMVEIRFPDPESARRFNQRLLTRAVPVHLARKGLTPERLYVNPTCLRESEIATLIEALQG
ncbi:aminotransferase class V-fold PLP-dependent enzyme [Actibacterium sp. MT2.3-13A]|uniref:aminotransferase class V-fold PLP-dependent enzyme n=1 Tax=Actibacterium sp. MT2.3-13A TaxID=2828332 RepID=UPI001BA67A9B